MTSAVTLLHWRRLGAELRSAMACYRRLPPIADAYAFLLLNPECFDYASWPEDMPADPPHELIAAYLDGQA